MTKEESKAIIVPAKEFKSVVRCLKYLAGTRGYNERIFQLIVYRARNVMKEFEAANKALLDEIEGESQ